jgi:hypothetical protein
MGCFGKAELLCAGWQLAVHVGEVYWPCRVPGQHRQRILRYNIRMSFCQQRADHAYTDAAVMNMCQLGCTLAAGARRSDFVQVKKG